MIDNLEAVSKRAVEDLVSLAKIPGVSADGFPPQELERSADRVAELMKEAGLENVEILRLEGTHPYVYGDWLHQEGAPTLLLYAHHDVQPPGRAEEWKSPPFEPTLRKDGRLYARGIVDDKAGFMVHQAAIRSLLERNGSLPVNVKFIVEGEEETGSEHLEAFLSRYKDRFAADAIVLTDTTNFDTGHPALTYRLRGLVVVDLEIRGLRQPVHSGMWGGPLADPALALSKVLGSLVDENGVPAIEGLFSNVRASDATESQKLRALPFNEATFRRQAGVLDGVSLVGEGDRSVWERLWCRPSLSVHAIEASSMKGAINQVVDRARARVSVRTVPDMDPQKTLEQLKKALLERVPWGLQAEITHEAAAPCWITRPEGKAFDLARSALKKGYGKAPADIGCGGTIPFVGPFAKVLGGVPALLIGVEDPYCNAHSENESLDLEDFKKGIASAAYLYQELSQL